jgi:hypothetical protein
MSRIRPWMNCVSLLASVTMIEQLSTALPSPSRRSQRPTNEKGCSDPVTPLTDVDQAMSTFKQISSALPEGADVAAAEPDVHQVAQLGHLAALAEVR